MKLRTGTLGILGLDPAINLPAMMRRVDIVGVIDG